MARDRLIRFVAGPENRLYPDLKENLPGRGVWVEASRSSVEKAVAKGLFARSLKTAIDAGEDLADLTGALLCERALQALGLARKAGLVDTGFAKVDSAIRSNGAALLLHAEDAAADGRRKLGQAIAFLRHMEGDDVLVADCWPSQAMSAVLGTGNVMHAAALRGGATANLVAAIRRWQAYEGREAPCSGFAATGFSGQGGE